MKLMNSEIKKKIKERLKRDNYLKDLFREEIDDDGYNLINLIKLSYLFVNLHNTYFKKLHYLLSFAIILHLFIFISSLPH